MDLHSTGKHNPLCNREDLSLSLLLGCTWYTSCGCTHISYHRSGQTTNLHFIVYNQNLIIIFANPVSQIEWEHVFQSILHIRNIF